MAEEVEDPAAIAARDQAWTEGLMAVRAGMVGNRWVRALRWVVLGVLVVILLVAARNIAHADVVTFGGFISLTIVTAFGFKEGVVNGPLVMVGLVLITAATMLICGALNITIERVAYRPLRNAPRVSPLITAAGMSFVLEGIMF